VTKINFDEHNHEIYLVSTERELKAQLEQISKVTLVVQLANVESNIRCKSIVLDGQIVNVQELQSIRRDYPTVPIFYKMYNITNQQQMKNIQTTCAAHNIHVLSEYSTSGQIKEEVSWVLFQQENGSKARVVSLFGTHSGAGVSTTLLNVADILGKKVNEKVLALSLNPWDPSDYFLPYEGKYLNDIKIELKTDSFSTKKLMQSIHQYEDFSHLAGNRDIKLQRYYKTDEISKLIEVAKQAFDVVLIDGGTHFDNAAFAQAYKLSDLKLLVTTQEPKGYRGYWPHIFHQLLEPIGGKTDDFLLILNQYCPDLSLITEKSLSEELDISLLATIPDQSLYGPTAIAQKKLLHQVTSNKDYRSSIEMIANSIVSRSRLTIRSDSNQDIQSKGFINKLFKKKQVN
jgi:Flp pilus assembly CpaE family ATPase